MPRYLNIYSVYYFSLSASSSHSRADASDGIRQSPRGESVTVPTFGPSGRQERLNCCAKNLRRKVRSQCSITSLPYSPSKA